MANRRQFLAGGIAIASFPVHAGSLLTGTDETAISGFVFDERFDHAAAMAQSLRQDNICSYSIHGDVAEVWHDHLAPAIQTRPRPIGGLTTAGGMFVLARLGHDAGLVLALHGTHSLDPDEPTALHMLDAPPLVRRRFETALKSGSLWTAALQTALAEAASCPLVNRVASADPRPMIPAGQARLHSWLLIPRS